MSIFILICASNYGKLEDDVSKTNETAFYNAIAARFKARRLELGLTQEEITARIGMERTTLAHIEAARQKPSLHQFYLLCRELHIEPGAFFSGWEEIAQEKKVETLPELEIKVQGTQPALTSALSEFFKSAQQTKTSKGENESTHKKQN